jgi:hypothetical protein
MPAGPGVKENAWLFDHYLSAIGLSHGQGAVTQDVQMPDIAFVVARNAAKPARIENAGGKREVSEEGRESIRIILLGDTPS